MEKINTQIDKITLEMSRTQINKSTEGHLGMLRSKLSKLNAQKIELKTQQILKQNQTIKSSLKVDKKAKLTPSELLNLQNDFLGNAPTPPKIYKIYIEKFSESPEIKSKAEADFVDYFDGKTPLERREFLVENVLPEILENLQKYLKKTIKPQKVGILLKALAPFAALQVEQEKIFEVTQSCLLVEELTEFWQVCRDMQEML